MLAHKAFSTWCQKSKAALLNVSSFCRNQPASTYYTNVRDAVQEAREACVHNQSITLAGETGAGKSWTMNALLSLSAVTAKRYRSLNKKLADENYRREAEKDSQEIKNLKNPTMTVLPESASESPKDDGFDTIFFKSGEGGCKPFIFPSKTTDTFTSVTSVPLKAKYGTTWHLLVKRRSEKWAREHVKLYVSARRQAAGLNSVADDVILEGMERSSSKLEVAKWCFEILTPLHYQQRALEGKEVEVEFTAEASALFGTSHIYSGNGQDSVADRHFVRESIKQLCHTDEDMGAEQVLLEELVCYCPCQILKKGRVLVDAPGSNDKDAFKIQAMTEALCSSKSVMAITAKNLGSCGSLSDVLEKDVIPQIASSNSSSRLIVFFNVEANDPGHVKLRFDDFVKDGTTDGLACTSKETIRVIDKINDEIRSYFRKHLAKSGKKFPSREAFDASVNWLMRDNILIVPCDLGLFSALCLSYADLHERPGYAELLAQTNGFQLLGALDWLAFSELAESMKDVVDKIDGFYDFHSSQYEPPARRETVRLDVSTMAGVSSLSTLFKNKKAEPQKWKNTFSSIYKEEAEKQCMRIQEWMDELKPHVGGGRDEEGIEFDSKFMVSKVAALTQALRVKYLRSLKTFESEKLFHKYEESIKKITEILVSTAVKELRHIILAHSSPVISLLDAFLEVFKDKCSRQLESAFYRARKLTNSWKAAAWKIEEVFDIMEKAQTSVTQGDRVEAVLRKCGIDADAQALDADEYNAVVDEMYRELKREVSERVTARLRLSIKCVERSYERRIYGEAAVGDEKIDDMFDVSEAIRQACLHLPSLLRSFVVFIEHKQKEGDSENDDDGDGRGAEGSGLSRFEELSSFTESLTSLADQGAEDVTKALGHGLAEDVWMNKKLIVDPNSRAASSASSAHKAAKVCSGEAAAEPRVYAADRDQKRKAESESRVVEISTKRRKDSKK